jgi:hypothetical protein
LSQQSGDGGGSADLPNKDESNVDASAVGGLPASEAVPAPPTAADAGAVLVTVGDIACTQTTVITPNGTYPLAGTNWIVTNNTRVTKKIPTYAIVLAIVFALLCLIGLLFLLMKEEVTDGSVQVSVQGGGLFYATQVPITDASQISDVDQRVNYIRGLVRALAA